MGGGPYTSWPRSLRLPSASRRNLCGRRGARKGAGHVDSAFSGKKEIQLLEAAFVTLTRVDSLASCARSPATPQGSLEGEARLTEPGRRVPIKPAAWTPQGQQSLEGEAR